jgi:hypothetical protein
MKVKVEAGQRPPVAILHNKASLLSSIDQGGGKRRVSGMVFSGALFGLPMLPQSAQWQRPQSGE